MTITVRDYDLGQVSQLLRSALTGMAMMAFLHIYMKSVLPSFTPPPSHALFRYTQPLFMQALMGVKGIYDAKEVHIHLLGKPAEGDLKRPFKAAGGMFGAAAGAPATDAAAIAEAEKRSGKKKDE